MQQPEVVTLCGSIRFAAEHLAAHRRLSLEGRVVLLPALPAPGEELAPADVEVLAALHRRKIDMSNRVHIVNPAAQRPGCRSPPGTSHMSIYTGFSGWLWRGGHRRR